MNAVKNGKLNRTGKIGRKETDYPRKSSAVAVCLTYQPLVPVCLKAVTDFRKLELIPDHRVELDARIEEKLKLWIDAQLLNEALVDLLRHAAYHSGDGSISFSVTYRRMDVCRIVIAYLLKDGENGTNYNPFPGYHDSRTEAIISQHRLAMDISRNKKRIIINLEFRH